MSNKVYNFFKWFITIFLPAAGALYYAIVEIFDIPRLVGMNGLINAVIAFLGIVLGISTAQYNKTANAPDGDLIVAEDEDGGKYLGLGVNTSVEAMTSKSQVKLNVVDAVTDPRMQRPEHLGDL